MMALWRNVFFASCLTLVSEGQPCLLPSLASEPWRLRSHEGYRQYHKKDYSQAIALYKQSLAMMPPGVSNERTIINGNLSLAYFKNKQYELCLIEGDRALDGITRLRNYGRLDPQALLPLQDLRQLWTNEAKPSPSKLSPEIKEKFNRFNLQLKLALGPVKEDNAEDLMRETRELIAQKKDKEARQDLENIFQRLKPSNSDYARVRLILGALRAKQGEPIMLQLVEKDLCAHMPPDRALRQIADAQVFVMDEEGAKANRERAMVLQGKAHNERQAGNAKKLSP